MHPMFLWAVYTWSFFRLFWIFSLSTVLPCSWSPTISEWILYVFNIDVVIHPDSHTISNENDGRAKPVIVFNHPHFLDAFVLTRAIGFTPCFVAKKSNVKANGLVYRMAKKYNTIFVNPGKTVEEMTAYRAKGHTLALSPDEGKHGPSQAKLIPFHTGAFVVSHDIDPVAIFYEDYETEIKWNGVKLLKRAILDRLVGKRVKVHVRILPTMHLTGPVDVRRDIVKNTIEHALSDMESSLDRVDDCATGDDKNIWVNVIID